MLLENTGNAHKYRKQRGARQRSDPPVHYTNPVVARAKLFRLNCFQSFASTEKANGLSLVWRSSGGDCGMLNTEHGK